ncbi:MAG: MlaE family lipid ABC transporter permease subunit [Rhizobiales bacterium]|nr:MlaE family lipid ABC transporter permease subunit [Hyphomicrobiales bacterium]
MSSYATSQDDPVFALDRTEQGVRARLAGRWTSETGNLVERRIGELSDALDGTRKLTVDVAAITQFDTLGAWVLQRLRRQLESAGATFDLAGARPEQQILLDEVAEKAIDRTEGRRQPTFVDLLAEIGETVHLAWKDLIKGTDFLGAIVVAVARVALSPARYRPAAFTQQIENIALRGVPIITLISFLVGAIVAQQSIFQLQRFGAGTFVVDLSGILVLRELGVLLASIMVAGRSGSAFTAEIGSMKMREEIDALRVMGLDPVEVLVVPRLLALVISLPILTFLASMAALFGAGLVSWFYGSISPEIFVSRLQQTIGMNTFLVGMIKAPFMAVIIGVIAAIEGLAVEGSAESLGRQVTSSVVKAIFMVIVMDGLFAMFFAAIRY